MFQRLGRQRQQICHVGFFGPLGPRKSDSFVKMINFDGANVSECRKYDLLTFCELIFEGPTGGPNGSVRSQLSALRSQVSGLRSQVSCLRSQVSGLRSQVSGLGPHVLGFTSQVPGLRSLVFGLRSQVSGPWVSLGCPWDSLGVLEGFIGSTGSLWGMGPAILKFWVSCNTTGPAQKTY